MPDIQWTHEAERAWFRLLPCRGEQHQRVVPPAPAVADARVAVEEMEPERCRPEMIPQRQARLARADDQDVEGMREPRHTVSFPTPRVRG